MSHIIHIKADSDNGWSMGQEMAHLHIPLVEERFNITSSS